MLRPRLFALLIALTAAPAAAVMFDATGDPNFNTTAPTGAFADSGWQYQAIWRGNLATLIAPHYFITAAHVGGEIGETLLFDDALYTTTAMFTDPLSDLRIWRVAEALPIFAPLYTAGDELGRTLVVIGRGTERGAEVRDAEGVLRGWRWGETTGRQRWGTNTVSGFANSGKLLTATFDHAGGMEAQLSNGDSGGAIFIQDTADGVWKLAGIALSVTGPYSLTLAGEDPFHAALFDHTGFFAERPDGAFVAAAPGPGEFSATRISAHLDFIESVVAPEPGSCALVLVGMGPLALRRARRIC